MARPGSRVVVALYRSFLREARDVDALPRGVLALTDPLNMEVYLPGARPFRYVDHPLPEASQTMEWLFPGLHTPLKAGDVSVDDAVKVIRDEFRREVDEEDTLDNRINLAMELLRRLTAVKAHQGCATVADTNGLRVALATTFFPAASDPPKAFAFAYRLRLTNVREDGRSLQVVSRGWRFEGDDGDVVEVPRGSPGVVGQTPVLKPGATFEYFSSTVLGSPSGVMQGTLQTVVLPDSIAASGFDTGAGAARAGLELVAEHGGGADDVAELFDAEVVETRLMGPRR